MLEFQEGTCAICGVESKHLACMSETDERLICIRCAGKEAGRLDIEGDILLGKLFGLLPADLE
uniref:Uncharacterized protein n=1 Tax=viral metagenome TaxID=1070528 RepID=A0A6M3L3V8_9ZZZZ